MRVNHQTKTLTVKNPSKISITVEKCIKTIKKLKNRQKFTKKTSKTTENASKIRQKYQ